MDGVEELAELDIAHRRIAKLDRLAAPIKLGRADRHVDLVAVAGEKEEEQVVRPGRPCGAGEGVLDRLGRRLLVGKQHARRMEQAGPAQAVVKFACIRIRVRQVRGAPTIIGYADEDREHPRPALDCVLAGDARAGPDGEAIFAGRAGPVGGHGHDIFAVFGEHPVDPAVERSLPVLLAQVVIVVLAAIGMAKDEVGVELRRRQIDSDPLAAPRGEAVAIGEFAARHTRVALRQPPGDDRAELDRLRGIGRGDRHVRGRQRGAKAIATRLAGSIGGDKDTIGAVGRKLRDDPAVQRIAAVRRIVIAEAEAVRPGDDEIGIEIVRMEIERDALPTLALEDIDRLIFSGWQLRAVHRQFAVGALPGLDRDGRGVAAALPDRRRRA